MLLECDVSGGGGLDMHPTPVGLIDSPDDQAVLLKRPEPGRQRTAGQAERVGEMRRASRVRRTLPAQCQQHLELPVLEQMLLAVLARAAGDEAGAKAPARRVAPRGGAVGGQ